MATTALRGYNPMTLAWKEISTPVPKNSARPTDIVDGGLFTVVALRKRRQQSQARRARLPIRPRPRTFHPRRRHPVYRDGLPLCSALHQKTSPSCLSVVSWWISKLLSTK
ncbi:hypothetical protein MRX96_050963 [Rhipicephalus microplus]